MKQSVKGIREIYFRDLINDYQDRKERSFLYRTFWAENVKALMKKLPLPGKQDLNRQLKELNNQFLKHLADEENGPEQMEEYFAQLSGEVKELLEVHLPQLPEEIVTLLGEHLMQLPGEVKRLLEESFPWLLKEEILWPKYENQIKELLKKQIEREPEWARSVLLRRPPRNVPRKKKPEEDKPRKEPGEAEEDRPQEKPDEAEEKGERRDFGVELWLNDAACEMGKIPDTGYYLWLVEYLAARDKYYKDNSIRDAHVWLYRLLIKGLKLEPELFRKNRSSICSKVDVEGYLTELAEKIQNPREGEREEICDRLHDLTCHVKTSTGQPRQVNYLLWLTGQLRRMSVHIQLKGWLQDNGYPLVKKKKSKGKTLPQKSRKQDFSMELFESFCDSQNGYDFSRKMGVQADEDWRVGDGFCVWKPDGLEDHLQTLLNILKQDGREDFYVPLAMDLRSGCVFFLAGKGYYQYVYKTSGNKELNKAYQKTKAFFCYDYLRLDKKKSMEDPQVTFQLYPAFHEHTGKSYEDIFEAFKTYCKDGNSQGWEAVTDEDGENEFYQENVTMVPRERIRELNDQGPIGIPEVFQWAFNGMKMPKPSRKAMDDLKRTKEKINTQSRSSLTIIDSKRM